LWLPLQRCFNDPSVPTNFLNKRRTSLFQKSYTFVHSSKQVTRHYMKENARGTVPTKTTILQNKVQCRRC
jgi:hypothetical protein